MAALSVSAFHRHFKAVTALSPIQYQKQVRLLHARTLLMAGQGNATSVAFGSDTKARTSSAGNMPDNSFGMWLPSRSKDPNPLL
jgi:methylphosphotriester-DNA--protein-cysteine methyltransferase